MGSFGFGRDLEGGGSLNGLGGGMTRRGRGTRNRRRKLGEVVLLYNCNL